MPPTTPPKVSIIMATYNRAKLLERSIEAIQKQIYQDWELIVSDDGSTDNTPDIMGQWQKKEKRIVYIRGPHRGIPQTYNQGLKKGTGEYFAMADDDDPWVDREKLQKQIAFLDTHPDYVACGSGMIVVNGEGVELYRFLKPETDDMLRNKMLFGNPMANATTVFRRSACIAAGWYNENDAYASDWDFWFRMAKFGKLYNFPEYFSYYTLNGKNISFLYARENLFSALKIMKRYRKDYPHFYIALCFHYLQCGYTLLPNSIQKATHGFLRRAKQKAVR